MRIRLATGSLVLCFMALGTGCSSAKPVESGHYGFLQDLDKGGHGGSRQTRRSAGRSPDGSIPEVSSERLQAFSNVRMSWPLRFVHVTSNFGKRGSSFHEGLDLRARPGTAVYAAHSGVVIYAGQRLHGYGKMVIVKHATGLSTIYAHNSRLLVIRGAKIKMGQKIAVTGNTGQSSGPHLHFEVRDGVIALDPLRVMPRTRAVAASKRVTASLGSRPNNS